MINKITHVVMLKLLNLHRKLLIARSPCDRGKTSSNQEFKFSSGRCFRVDRQVFNLVLPDVMI